MARNLITGDKAIQGVKAGDPRKRLNDGDGLYLLLSVKGGAHGWRFDYAFQGARKTLSLGTYPETGLQLARRKADEYRKMLAEGTNPSDTRKAVKVQRQAAVEADERRAAGEPEPGSFQAVALEWVDVVHRTKVSAGHADRTLIRLQQDVFPWLGAMPIAQVSAPKLLEVIRRIESRGAIETAHRAKDSCGQVFRYGVATGRCERNPAADLRDAMKAVNTKHMAAITEPKRVGELLRAIDKYTGSPVTRAALRLAPLLFQRPGNLRAMEWAELDLDAAMWTIPAAKMKRSIGDKLNGQPHLVPLSPQAIAILRHLYPLTGHHKCVFPSTRGGGRPMSDGTLNAALERLDFDTQEEQTTHGFRAMARTLLREKLNVNPEVIEAQLAHGKSGPLGAAYDRTTFVQQRIDMMKTWADYLDQLRKGADVIPIKAA